MPTLAAVLQGSQSLEERLDSQTAMFFVLRTIITNMFPHFIFKRKVNGVLGDIKMGYVRLWELLTEVSPPSIRDMVCLPYVQCPHILSHLQNFQ